MDTHAPVKSKTIIERPKVPWFDSELKSLKSQRRKAEGIWKRDKHRQSLQAYHQMRTRYVNSLNAKRTHFLADLISDARGDTKKLFTLVNGLCDKRLSNPLPPHDSLETLVNTFGTFFLEKINIHYFPLKILALYLV